MIESVVDDEIGFCVIVNMTMLITREFRREPLVLEIYEYVSRPRVIRTKRNKCSSRNKSFSTSSSPIMGNSNINLVKTKYFFDLAIVKSRLNSYRITILLLYFPLITLMVKTNWKGFSFVITMFFQGRV